MTKIASKEPSSTAPHGALADRHASPAGRPESSALTNAQMVKRNKENLVRDGGRVLNTLRLQPEAAVILAKLENTTQQSATAILNDLLVKAGRRLK